MLAMASLSNMDISAGPPDFSKPWMYSDVVLDIKVQISRSLLRSCHVVAFVQEDVYVRVH